MNSFRTKNNEPSDEVEKYDRCDKKFMESFNELKNKKGLIATHTQLYVSE